MHKLILLLIISIPCLAVDTIVNEVRVPARATIGLPIPVVYTVAGPAKMVETRLYGDVNPFALVLRNSDGHTLTVVPQLQQQQVAAPADTITVGPDGISMDLNSTATVPAGILTVPQGKVVNGSFDLSSVPLVVGNTEFFAAGLPDHELLPSGRYQLSLRPGSIRVDQALPAIQLVSPNEAERKLLDFLVKEAYENRKLPPSSMNPLWKTFVQQWPKLSTRFDFQAFSSESTDQLHFYVVLGQLVADVKQRKPSTFNPVWLSKSPTYYHIDLLILQFEVLSRAGQKQRAKIVRQSILHRCPYLEELLDFTEKRGGIIQLMAEND